MQKFDEAVQVLLRAVNLKPDNKVYFRQLGAVYSKAGNNPKSTESLMVYMAMNAGKTNPDPAGTAKAAKAGSPAASLLASLGPPEAVYDWESDARKLQTWKYDTKKQAYTFDAGTGALVRDYFVQGLYPDGTSGNASNNADRKNHVSGALVKALLVASAEFMDGPGLFNTTTPP